MSGVSVIGLGAMGSALAGALLKSGLSVTLWNRSPAKAEALVAKGAVAAASVKDAVEASKLVVACLLVYDTVYEAFEPAKDALAGRTLVNLTNGTPAQAREMAQWAATRGADYLDGSIMAVPPMIGQAEALILYSGAHAAFDAHGKTLGALGAARYLGGDAGLAPLHDIALLTAMYGLFSGVTHAFALTGSEKVPAEKFLPMLTNWLGAVMTWLPDMARRIDASLVEMIRTKPQAERRRAEGAIQRQHHVGLYFLPQPGAFSPRRRSRDRDRRAYPGVRVDSAELGPRTEYNREPLCN